MFSGIFLNTGILKYNFFDILGSTTATISALSSLADNIAISLISLIPKIINCLFKLFEKISLNSNLQVIYSVE